MTGSAQDYVTHLESPIDGSIHSADTVAGTHKDRPLCVRYDLDAIREAVSPQEIGQRPPDLWRYRELLPVDSPYVSLGETMTPLVECELLAAELGLRRLLVKDESRLPTGSFKARGMAVAISKASELGLACVALPSAGNAGGAAAAYAARAGMECVVFMPRDTPEVNRHEVRLMGATVRLVDGLIGECGVLAAEGAAAGEWFNLATLREPYRLEGKKTMGLELAEQLDWNLPDAIFYPTGGGTGLIGMHKAFGELAQLGWIESATDARLFACQSSGCAPLAAAFMAGERFAKPVTDPHTVASGLRVPSAIGDFLVLDAVRETGGAVLTASEQRLGAWMQRVGAREGISLCPESAVCFDALEQAIASGSVGAEETVVVFNTGAAQKYVEVLRSMEPV